MSGFDELFGGTRVMVILRGLGPARSLELAHIAWDAGLRVLEIPVQSARDVETLRTVAEAAAERGLSVGAGTVITPEAVAIVLAAGAEFTVSPGYDPVVIAAAEAAGLAALPGVGSASDIQAAVASDREWLKVFPAAPLGVDWMRAMRGPFPATRLVATGGIDAGNAAMFLDAGAAAVAVGAAAADPAELRRLARLHHRGRQDSGGVRARASCAWARCPGSRMI